MASKLVFAPDERRLLGEARRATLATISPDGSPRLVPVCYALHATDAILYSPLDDKPKRVADPLDLARVRDIAADPRVTLLVDRWDESWTRLAWLRCHGLAALLEPNGEDRVEHAAAVRGLRDRYEQYLDHDLGSRPILRIAVHRTSSWGQL